MKIIDLIKTRNPFKQQPKRLVLDSGKQEEWAKILAEYTGLDKSFKQFIGLTSDLREEAEGSLGKFSDEGVLAAIPDRARTMNALHGNEYATQVRKLLLSAEFKDLFGFEKDQERYFETNAAFKDQTAKNVSALREFMHDEIKITQEILQKLEDLIINFTKILEDDKYPQIRKISELYKKANDLEQRGEKYLKLQSSLELDLKRTTEKKKKLDGEIQAQLSLIRNDAARIAFEKLGKLEEEINTLTHNYLSVCDDIKALMRKYPEFRLDAKTKRVIDELPKDDQQFISQNSEAIKNSFENIISILEEGNYGNMKRTIERLSKLMKSAESDSRSITTSVPDLRAYKKDVLKDIAAVNAYDKQQFLHRAVAEEKSINAKLDYLRQELDSSKRAALRNEMKAIAKDLGATIEEAPAKEEKLEKEPQPKEEIIDIEDSQDNRQKK